MTALLRVLLAVAVLAILPVPAHAADRVALDDAEAAGWFGEHWYRLERREMHVGWMRRSLTRTEWKGRPAVVREVEQLVNVAGDGNAMTSRIRTVFEADGEQRLVAILTERTAQGRTTTRRIDREGDTFKIVTEPSRDGPVTRPAQPAYLGSELGLERLARAWEHAGDEEPEARITVFGIDPGSLRRTRRVLRVQRADQTDARRARGHLVIRSGDGRDAWSEPMVIDGAGALVEGPLLAGIHVRRATAEEAKSRRTMSSLRRASLVPVQGDPGDLATITKIVFSADARAAGVFPSIGRQKVEAGDDGRVRITVDRQGGGAPFLLSEIKAMTRATPEYDYANKRVQRALQSTLRGTSSRGAQVQRLLLHVAESIEYMVVMGDPSASEILRSKRGDCTEAARLFIAFCRGARIPAREVRGVIWSPKDATEGGGHLGWHAWAEVEMKGLWREADPSAGALPAHPVRLRVADTVETIDALDDLDLRVESIERE